ncbi:MAG: response regulator transcription factor [Oscillospiraceae bacterium]|nr:response regulator transcription factor [Oscillospiraceae bacterium]MBR3535872.1 response regulator transcription factor [Oscillospiraceae bacterium]MBR6835595.1 response regulator transcription factor [Oscillospiraceae bacterium]MBR6925415.1 response regulator transcription factor [Oscillospiraceae bacterium]
MNYQVLIADDYRMIRQMFEEIIKGAGGRYSLAGTVDNAEEAITFCRFHSVDLVVMDVVMGSGMDGIDAAAEIKKFSPHTKVLIVTSMPESSFIRRAKEAGVDSFWHKEVQDAPLLDVIDRTMDGESVYPMSMPEVWFGNTVSTSLTERELDVLHGLVGGSSNSEIAGELGISERSVKQHITDMLNKTGFRSRLQLAVRARGDGIVINDFHTV